MTSRTGPKNREIELDFVRGLAILMVLDYHSPRSFLLVPFEWLGFENFGWTGVDVFFVLSGFLVGGLLIKEWCIRGSIDRKRFLVRRGLKIWPQYYVYILLMLITRHRNVHQLWGNLLNIQNYVGGVAHTWTLAVEEHAYLLLAILLPLAARLRVRLRHMFLLIAAASLTVVGWQYSLASRGVDVFERTDTRIQGILLGVLVAIVYHHRPGTFLRLRGWTWLWLTLLALSLFDLRIRPTVWWESTLNTTMADLMGLALLMLLYKHRNTGQRPLLYRLVAWIGLYSYGIYLWHVSVIAPSVALLSYLPPSARIPLEAVVPSVAGIGLGVLATRSIEFPTLALRDRLFPRKVDSAVGIPGEIEEQTGVRTKSESVSANI